MTLVAGLQRLSSTHHYTMQNALEGCGFHPQLLYSTGGLAWADDQFTRTQLTGDGVATPPVGFIAANNGTRIGWVAGAGVEWGFARNWSAKLEYLFMDFGSNSFSFTVPAGTFAVSEGDLALHTVRVGVNYRFY